MPPAPPSFGSQEYWNKRFTANPSPFEWLEAPNVLDPYIVDALRETEHPDPQLLHIGCGTSLLSYHLRAHVENPQQIHNLDYADSAIELGRAREAELCRGVDLAASEESLKERDSAINMKAKASLKPPQQDNQSRSAPCSADDSSSACMRWSSANLLDYASLLEACQISAYSVVVDKSTSDSIACSDDLYVPLPYPVAASHMPTDAMIAESPEPLHPLYVMAVHLALVTKPGGRWISLSYSTDRYPFLHVPRSVQRDGSAPFGQSTISIGRASQQRSGKAGVGAYAEKESINDDSFPNPSDLWKLVGKSDIAAPEERDGDGTTHRPKVSHWVYVLERTNTPLHIREQ